MDDSIDIYDDSYLYPDTGDQKRPLEEDTNGGPPEKIVATDDDVFAGYGVEKPLEETSDTVHAENTTAEVHYGADATMALQIDELSWWTSDEDLTTIAEQVTGVAGCVKDIGFFEHKINGKSRGTAWLLLDSIESAAKLKQRLESIEIDKRHPIVNFASASYNPYRALPKDNFKTAPNATRGGFNRPYVARPQIGGRGAQGGMHQPPFRPPSYLPQQGGFPPPPLVGYRPHPMYNNMGGMGYAPGMQPGGRPPMFRPRPPPHMPPAGRGYGYDAGLGDSNYGYY